MSDNTEKQTVIDPTSTKAIAWAMLQWGCTFEDAKFHINRFLLSGYLTNPVRLDVFADAVKEG